MQGAIPIVNLVYAIFDELEKGKRTDLKLGHHKNLMRKS